MFRKTIMTIIITAVTITSAFAGNKHHGGHSKHHGSFPWELSVNYGKHYNGDSYYGYKKKYYGSGCYKYKRYYKNTGKHYWWKKYQACLDYND